MADDCAILVTGGTLIDGTGSPGVAMEIAIDGSQITGLHPPGEMSGSAIIDAQGGVVCPGFVDIHTHSDLSLLAFPTADSKVRQGVTTEIVGNCGSSAGPAIGAARSMLDDMAELYGISVDWTSLDEYLSRLSDAKTSVNVASLVGAESVRTSVLGEADVKPSKDELLMMKNLVSEAMTNGAYGLSSGLIYAPGCFASTDELIALADSVSPFDGVYASHIRGEGRTLLKAVEEAICIGKSACVKVQISHHKVIGFRNWGLVEQSLQLIQNANDAGTDVAFDVYPYTASCTNLYAVLPPWVQDGGRAIMINRLRQEDVRKRIKHDFKNLDTSWENTVAEDGWENIEVSGFTKPDNRMLEHRRMTEIGMLRGVDPADAALDILLEEGFDLMGIFHEIDDDDVMRVISHPLAIVASDGETETSNGPCRGTATHPRAYGTFPRAIREYALNRNVVSLEEMIRKMTYAPADRIGLVGRGRLARGMMADIVVFDREEIRATSTYEKPNQYAKGIKHVIVNGSPTISDGEHTGERAGTVLRKTRPTD
ncbi:MAG: D-aminoacylase [Methanobacteriota archaeon]|nr:MAG: D-aminoacylase [Euryarchaeota archaeon]